MDLLIMVNNEITIAPHAVPIKEFNDIWESDNDPKKLQAKKELSFIYNQCYWDTIYKGYDEEERMEVLRSDILEGGEISKNLLAGITKYKQIQAHHNPAIIYLDEHIEIMLSLRKYYKNIDWGAKDLKGNLLYKPKDVTTAMKDAKIVIDKCTELRENVIKNESTGSVRGDVQIGQFSQ